MESLGREWELFLVVLEIFLVILEPYWKLAMAVVVAQAIPKKPPFL